MVDFVLQDPGQQAIGVEHTCLPLFILELNSDLPGSADEDHHVLIRQAPLPGTDHFLAVVKDLWVVEGGEFLAKVLRVPSLRLTVDEKTIVAADLGSAGGVGSLFPESIHKSYQILCLIHSFLQLFTQRKANSLCWLPKHRIALEHKLV